MEDAAQRRKEQTRHNNDNKQTTTGRNTTNNKQTTTTTDAHRSMIQERTQRAVADAGAALQAAAWWRRCAHACHNIAGCGRASVGGGATASGRESAVGGGGATARWRGAVGGDGATAKGLGAAAGGGASARNRGAVTGDGEGCADIEKAPRRVRERTGTDERHGDRWGAAANTDIVPSPMMIKTFFIIRERKPALIQSSSTTSATSELEAGRPADSSHEGTPLHGPVKHRMIRPVEVR